MKLHKFLKNKRIEANLIQSEMAMLLEVSRCTYNKLEKKNCKPGFITIRKIADYYNLSEDEVRSML